MSGVEVANPSAPGGQSIEIGHMPFAEDPLSQSCKATI